MGIYNSGFHDGLFQQHNRNKASTGTALKKFLVNIDEVRKTLRENYGSKESDPIRDAISMTSDKSVPMTYRVQLNEGSNRLNLETADSIAKAFNSDQKLIRELLSSVNNVHPGGRVSLEQASFNRTYVREAIEESRRSFLEGCQLKEPEWGSHKQAAILEDFFKLCPFPNPAELVFLASIVAADEKTISDWFNKKRLKMRTVLFAQRKMYSGKSPAREFLRKRRLDLENDVANADGTRAKIVDWTIGQNNPDPVDGSDRK